MKKEVTLKNLQRRVRLNPSQLKKTALKVLRHERVSSFDLSIVFVTGRKIKALNKKYLHRDYSTDVLAFDLSQDFTPKGKKNKRIKIITGEVIISADTALKNSVLYRTTPKEEIMLYVIHGILHLLGHDDSSRKGKHLMRLKEQKILQVVKA